MEYLQWCLSNEIKPIKQAGLLPTGNHIEIFSESLDEHDGSKISEGSLKNVLDRFNEMANVRGNYFLCRQTEMSDLARELEDVALSIVSRRVPELSSHDILSPTSSLSACVPQTHGTPDR